jgi:hypothetical protein
MKQIQTLEDVYPALDELVIEFKAVGQSRLAAILDHRMHRVAWTARSELFDELRNVLTKAMQSEDTDLPQPLKDQTERILRVINGYLNSEV